MQFIGIDLHTNKFTYCYRDERSADKRTETFDLNEAGLAAFYGTLSADTHVLVEATITTFSFVRLFKDRVKEVIIANTYELKQISLARTNTDNKDQRSNGRGQTVPAHQDAGAVRGADGLPGDPAAS